MRSNPSGQQFFKYFCCPLSGSNMRADVGTAARECQNLTSEVSLCNFGSQISARIAQIDQSEPPSKSNIGLLGFASCLKTATRIAKIAQIDLRTQKIELLQYCNVWMGSGSQFLPMEQSEQSVVFVFLLVPIIRFKYARRNGDSKPTSKSTQIAQIASRARIAVPIFARIFEPDKGMAKIERIARTDCSDCKF